MARSLTAPPRAGPGSVRTGTEPLAGSPSRPAPAAGMRCGPAGRSGGLGGEDTRPSVPGAGGLPRRTSSPSLASHLGIAAEPPGLEGKQQPAPSGAGAGAGVAGMEEEGKKNHKREARGTIWAYCRGQSLLCLGELDVETPSLLCAGFWGHPGCGTAAGVTVRKDAVGSRVEGLGTGRARGCYWWLLPARGWPGRVEGAGWGRRVTSTALPPGVLQSPSADDFSGVQAADARKG